MADGGHAEVAPSGASKYHMIIAEFGVSVFFLLFLGGLPPTTRFGGQYAVLGG